MHLSVAIPCFNEAQTNPRLATALDLTVAELQAARHHPEVLVVDDGSFDGSAVALKSRRLTPLASHHHLTWRRNFGQTAAMSTGFAAAAGDVIIPMDADIQNDTADIPRLLAKVDEGFDVVSRWLGWVSGVPLTIMGAR